MTDLTLSRRDLLKATVAATTLACLPHIAAAAPIEDRLDAVDFPLGATFNPRIALQAIMGLSALGKPAALSALRDCATRHRTARRDTPSGLFAVARALFEVPSLKTPPGEGLTVLRPGYLRPPALGAPQPPQPADLTLTPRFPLVIVDDVPLTLVSGYVLGGKAEPLEMHLDALDAEATWRGAPLAPKGAAVVRYTLPHWGGLPPGTAEMVEAQLVLYETTPHP